jgi:hypothetical protein
MKSVHVCEFEILAHMWFGTRMLSYIRVWQSQTSDVVQYKPNQGNFIIDQQFQAKQKLRWRSKGKNKQIDKVTKEKKKKGGHHNTLLQENWVDNESLT